MGLKLQRINEIFINIRMTNLRAVHVDFLRFFQCITFLP